MIEQSWMWDTQERIILEKRSQSYKDNLSDDLSDSKRTELLRSKSKELFGIQGVSLALMFLDHIGDLAPDAWLHGILLNMFALHPVFMWELANQNGLVAAMRASSKHLRSLWDSANGTDEKDVGLKAGFRTKGRSMLNLLCDSPKYVNATRSHPETYTLLWLLHKGLCIASHHLTHPPRHTMEEHIEQFVGGIELYLVTPSKYHRTPTQIMRMDPHFGMWSLS